MFRRRKTKDKRQKIKVKAGYKIPLRGGGEGWVIRMKYN
jgi:hypothetical protein